MIKPKWKVPNPPNRKRVETRDKKEASKLKRTGFVQKN